MDSSEPRAFSLLYLTREGNTTYVSGQRPESACECSTDSIDPDRIYADVCRDFTRNALRQLNGLLNELPAREDGSAHFPFESIECDLIKSFYTTLAAASLLEREVARAVVDSTEKLDEYVVCDTVKKAGLDPETLRAFVTFERRRRYSTRTATPARRCMLMLAYPALIVATLGSLALVLLSKLRGERTSLGATHSSTLYLVHEKLDNRARVLIKARPPEAGSPLYACLLGTGLKNANRLRLRGDSDCFVRPWRRRAVLRAAKDVWAIWPTYISYVIAIAAQFPHRAAFFWLLFQSGLRMIRGRLHMYWVNSPALPSCTTEACIDWTGWSDVTQFDLALQTSGIETSHYLHGLVGDALSYWGASTRCICRTTADAALMVEFGVGRYRHVTSGARPRSIVFERPPAKGPLLVITNLLHPANIRYGRIAEPAQRAMFEMVAEASAGRFDLIWRPHPAEPTNKRCFPKFRELALTLGFRIVGDALLAQQIERSAFVITSFSSVISEVIAAGRLPFVFAAVPWEDTPAWRGIPAHLKFSAGWQLKRMLDPAFYQALCQADNSGLNDLVCVDHGGRRDNSVGSGSTG